MPPSERSYELTRLSLYRIGLAGMYAKYRFVPRSAIVDYEGLRKSVRAYRGTNELHGLLAELWQRHGAPSRAGVDAFLEAARELDRRGAGASPKELEVILAQPSSLAGVSEVAARDLDDARLRLLEAWLRACAPRSAVGRLRDHGELAVCFAFRRARQYAYAVAALVRPSGSNRS